MAAKANLEIVSHPSPNSGPRREAATPDLIVLHFTAMATAEAALARLCDPEAEVSAHYLIAEDGRIWQMVEEAERAWHAGAGAWGDVTDVNSRSIGIELSNDGASPFPEAQMSALEALMPEIIARWTIRPERVIAHSDMAPGRKQDPGRRFDWRRLAIGDLSIWSDGGGADATFRDAAAAFGYPGAVDDTVLLDAFRQRFRPWAEGPLSEADTSVLCDLARRFPVDRAPSSA